MSQQLTIEYEDDLLATLGLSPRDFASEAKFLLAAKLYELGKVSSGLAAKFCGMERVAFLLALPRSGVPVSNLTIDDLEDELRLANE